MRVITFLIVAVCYSNVYSQLKQIDVDQVNSVTPEVELTVPEFKKNLSTTASNATDWAPVTLAYEFDAIVSAEVIDGDLPILITGHIPHDKKESLSTVDHALAYLEKAADLMHISDPRSEWKVVRSKVDDLGMYHVKFQQLYQGIPVYGSEVIVHGDRLGMNAVNGRYIASPEGLSITPAITDAVAEDLSIADIGSIVRPEEDKFGLFSKQEPVTKEMVIYQHEGQPTLAYHLTIYKNIVERWEYFVDAQTGAVLRKHESICRLHNHSLTHICEHTATAPVPPVVSSSQDLFGQTQSINTWQQGSNFFMLDAARTEMFDGVNSNMPNEPIGTIWTIDAFNTSPQKSDFTYDHVSSSNMNFPNKQVAVSAHVNGGRAFDYFLNVHDRLSINKEGGNIISLVNVSDEDGNGMDNAFWNGVAMFYGNGRSAFDELAKGLDVAGHEMSHGVIQSEANLEYQGESGALNESWADVFGVMIDRDDWTVGEDVVRTSAFPSGALRSLQDPHNGAATNDFGRGWQPRHYNERFTGPEDNNGVHINSGIPNYAFFKFASNVGRSKAEKVWYRALTNYMTRSSQFVDARVATVRATMDLYGDSEVAALRTAWTEVGVVGEDGNDYEVDVETNPGQDFIVFTVSDQGQENNLYVSDPDEQLIFDPLTFRDPISKPSVTDNGSEITYVTSNNDLGYAFVDWETTAVTADFTFVTLNNNQDTIKWRNVAFSKDGSKLAALRTIAEPMIYVFDFNTQQEKFFPLTNPTFSQDSTSTADVLYADVMEWDFTGEYIMYDSENQLKSIFDDGVTYWDIGFMRVWDNEANTFAPEGQIQKLFGSLPEGVSIGNPTFSKNSPYIIAYDEIINGQNNIRGVNLETNTQGTLRSNNGRLGYPSFSNDDELVIFDAANTQGLEVIGATQLSSDKVNAEGQPFALLTFEVGVRWGTWFSNGTRVLSNTDDETLAADVKVFPNPTTGDVQIALPAAFPTTYAVEVLNMVGKVVASAQQTTKLDINHLPAGQYIVSVKADQYLVNTMITKK